MPEGRSQRRLAAIMAADVVGYSRLMRADEEGTLARLKSMLRDMVDPRISNHGGRVVKLMGDGLLVEYASVVDAVRSAVSIQEAISTHNVDVPAGLRIEFRIGINLGDVVIDGDDIYGDGVNVAARLEGLAEAGGLSISGAVYDQVRDHLALGFRDLGEQEVKNINRPIRVWQWIRDGSAPREGLVQSAPGRPLPDRPSIVVLPFANMSRDPDQDFFSDGISEDIITDLSKVSGLFVIARNSAFVYRDKAVNIPQVCKDLGVRYALEGSIRKAGNRVRVTAQLIDGSSGGHLWAERYDRELVDIFEVQDDLTRQIVSALKVTLTPSESSLIGDAGTRNLGAHQAFLRGRELIFRPDRGRLTFEEAMSQFRLSIAIDPDYGAPYAGLALALLLDYQNHWTEHSDRSLIEAQHLVGQAIARNDRDPFAHYAAAVTYMFVKDFERWASAADRALALNPNYAPALNTRGLVHLYGGQPLDAVSYIEQAMRLDPAFRHQYMHFLGVAYFLAGDHEAASEIFAERIRLSPQSDMTRAFLASALGHLGRAAEAVRVWHELKAINPAYLASDHVARLPFRRKEDEAKLAEGLRMAGISP